MASILIAEDSATIFKLLSFRLNHLGHETIWAQDGQQALVAMREHQPDLVLLDVLMPVYDGFQVLKQAKADPVIKNIPIIILTAINHKINIVAGIRNGAEDYIMQPASGRFRAVRVEPADTHGHFRGCRRPRAQSAAAPLSPMLPAARRDPQATDHA